MRNNILILLFLSVTTSGIAQVITDSSKQNGNWDPNDPNCPCYEIQKQAEKEHQELLKQKQDSILTLHQKGRIERKKKMQRNNKRKKKNECPQMDFSRNNDCPGDKPWRLKSICFQKQPLMCYEKSISTI